MERVQNPVRRRDLRHSHEEEAERAVNAYSDLILRLSYTYLKSTHEAQDICQEVNFVVSSAVAVCVGWLVYEIGERRAGGWLLSKVKSRRKETV